MKGTGYGSSQWPFLLSPVASDSFVNFRVAQFSFKWNGNTKSTILLQGGGGGQGNATWRC